MKTSSWAAITAGFVVALANLSATAADNTAKIADAKQMIAANRYVEGLAAAKDALRADPTDFRGEYYVAMALMGLRQHDEARAAANRALSLAPAASKPAVQKLIGSIDALRSNTTRVAAADAALADGLAGKAAGLYVEAWADAKSNAELAFKAADLYAGKLQEPAKAAWILRETRTADSEGRYTSRIDAALGSLAPTLIPLATNAVQAARSASIPQALEFLMLAEIADPTNDDIYKTRVRVLARGTDFAALRAAISQLARRDLATAAEFSEMPHLNRWSKDAEFRTFVTDMIGAGAAQELWNNTTDQLFARINGLANFSQLASCEDPTEDNCNTLIWWGQIVSNAMVGPCQSQFGLAPVKVYWKKGNYVPAVVTIDWSKTGYRGVSGEGPLIDTGQYLNAQTLQFTTGGENGWTAQWVKLIIGDCSTAP